MGNGCNHKHTIFTAHVLESIEIGPLYHRTTFQLDEVGSKAFADAVPGQFAELDLTAVSLPPLEKIPPKLVDACKRNIILRRPFSFADIRKDNPGAIEIDILFCVLGPATVRMTSLRPGDSVSVIGPLGNGFSVPEGTKNALLVAGGMGAPPLQHLGFYLRENFPDMNVVAFAGAKSKEDLPYQLLEAPERDTELAEFSRCDVPAHIATDDGSIGMKGFVTQALENWIRTNDPKSGSTVIYTCGPEPMLAQVAKIAISHDLPCQVSMERRMACGIGLCQSCAIEVRTPASEETVYKLCCKDGPIFDARELVF
ncbi:Dihydroorotate oxidase B, electron transfer subunit [Anaerohalosphaera lusitana]|uniref:Dihydroorotate oxidase B, electron transfer subunit n=1 Tax=Anaerohalosphaera lusitana TaxID=1936003 RepID=A0A1U9NNH3_9BACT|nr:dihydroorotate dehydrogenase electron transfer subunit [Anaerohalosphaera lusitana]AQT69066.1 Dihydroorotate oxidase B, electron transfer subunit [Anaerohalosphaera lusitana]